MVKKPFLILFIIILASLFISYAYWISTPKNDAIVLGASLPLSGINKELGTEVATGANIWFEYLNAKGGVRGRKIQFNAYDDKYEPQNTAHNLERLLKIDQAFALFGFVGTPTIKKIFPNITSEHIPMVASYTGAAFLRQDGADSVINFRTSYQNEIDTIVEHLHVTQGLTRFAIFYQNDVFGEEGYIATVNALKNHGLELSGEGTYKRNTLSIRHALHEIQSINPQAVIIVGAYKPSAHFIQVAREQGLTDVVFCPISFVNADALVVELGHQTKNILFSQTVPPYTLDASDAAKEYHILLSRYAPHNKPSFASYETFLAAKAFTHALEQISGRLTRTKLLNELTNNKIVDLGGVKIGYNPIHMHPNAYLYVYDNKNFHLVYERMF
jgi:ABC-type branched-subunit amino acid transport system substrate-binding protein